MVRREETSLDRAIREYYEVLDSLKWTGASQIGELAQLKVLIDKYPDNARQLVTERDDRRAEQA